MANTRDIIGDQATLDGLVSHTLTELEEDGVTELSNYTLYYNSALIAIKFPNLKKVGDYFLQHCTTLETATLPEVTSLSNYAFHDCKDLITLTAPKLTALYNFTLGECKSLNTLDTSKLQRISNSAAKDAGIGQLILPVCTNLGKYIGGGSRLSIVDLTESMAISADKFNGAAALCHLILRSTTLCALASSALTGTGLANGKGYIYVPTDLVDTYKADSNWSTYAAQIADISEYPKALQDETISDSWADILAAEENGTYSTKYSVGDIKYLDVGGTQLAMQIAAFDADTLTAGGTAKITWISRELLDKYLMNNTNIITDGWAASKMREWLRNVIYPQIESTVRAAIKSVTKTYKDHTTSSTLSIADTVWIPSAREIFGGTAYEDSGCDYTSLFNDSPSRIKKPGLGSSSASYWWLRSASSGVHFYSVTSSGNNNSYFANSSIGVVLGFCT